MVILLGDAAKTLKDFNDNCIDLTVTSPPYDNLRTYGGYTFNFEAIAKELYRVTREGGVMCWQTSDSAINGDESGNSFKQALYFKEIGFKLHDTMVTVTNGFRVPSYKAVGRYHQVFQHLFILSKRFVKTFNPIKDRKNKNNGAMVRRMRRTAKDDLKYENPMISIEEYGMRTNVWFISNGGITTSDSIAYEHPAVMNEILAEDLIKSWSNEGDLILDPFAGSGTTLKAAHQLNRKWVGIEINPDYIQLAKKRLTPYIQQQRLEKFIF